MYCIYAIIFIHMGTTFLTSMETCSCHGVRTLMCSQLGENFRQGRSQARVGVTCRQRDSNRPVKRYIPFSEGARICAGRALADVYMTATLANLLSHFTFTLAERVRLDRDVASFYIVSLLPVAVVMLLPVAIVLLLPTATLLISPMALVLCLPPDTHARVLFVRLEASAPRHVPWTAQTSHLAHHTHAVAGALQW